jgi:hypothetical protein
MTPRLPVQERELARLRAEVERLRAAGVEAVRRGAESRREVEAERDRYRQALELIADCGLGRGDLGALAAGQAAREALDG